MNFPVKTFHYRDRIGNLKAESKGVVKGEKHFPVFEGGLIFKPLTRSKPFTTPLFAYAEVFWSVVINEYFMRVPLYELAYCEGYSEAVPKYYDYGTTVPVLYGKEQHLMNLLEFYRQYPDDHIDIDQYVNYCMMFYDYTDVFETSFFKENREIADSLAMHVLCAILKGDQNYHYENVAFLCDNTGEILRLAPMIDHEFSTYFMFPDDSAEHVHWLVELLRSVDGQEVADGEYDFLSDPQERRLMEQSAVCLHRNLIYIREHYPKVTVVFLKRLERFMDDLKKKEQYFEIRKAVNYPSTANSLRYRIGMAKYKEHDEELARTYENQYGDKDKEIDFNKLNNVLTREILTAAEYMKEILQEN